MGRAKALRTLLAIAVACALLSAASCTKKPAGDPPPLPPLSPRVFDGPVDLPAPRPKPEAPPDPVDQATVDALVGAHAAFGLAMLGEITGGAPEENVFISPTRIALALSMAVNGAAGETREAMLTALQLSDMSIDDINAASAQLMVSLAEAEPHVTLSLANSLWAQEGIPFEAGFMATNDAFYQAEVSALDLSSPMAPKTINAWVARQTHDRIADIVEAPIAPQAILILINALYFKGEWYEPFEERDTEDGPFTLPDGRTESVPLMLQWGNYAYLEMEGFQAVRLPYAGKRAGMYIFLPSADSDLEAFAEALTPSTWQGWLEQFGEHEGHLRLPRFEIEYGTGLAKALARLGMGVAFSSAADFANLTPMTAQITKAEHKTTLLVDENGTEAAAATLLQMAASEDAPVDEPFEMIVNRPFFCAIVDQDTGSVLFAGYVVDPT
ncbi:MAG TPA: serpin family protein [Armatimonadota bacterium]|nr:serpin family protein [Armatimonadota bacterium]